MDIDRIIGSAGIRISTLVAALLLATAVVLRESTVAPLTESALFLLSIVLGIVAFVGLIHSFRALYHRWLALAAYVQRVVVTLLFGGCYLFVVVWFYLFSRVINLQRTRSRSERQSLWILRRPTDWDERYFTRMG